MQLPITRVDLDQVSQISKSSNHKGWSWTSISNHQIVKIKGLILTKYIYIWNPQIVKSQGLILTKYLKSPNRQREEAKIGDLLPLALCHVVKLNIILLTDIISWSHIPITNQNAMINVPIYLAFSQQNCHFDNAIMKSDSCPNTDNQPGREFEQEDAVNPRVTYNVK